jgi:hypothetical protein
MSKEKITIQFHNLQQLWQFAQKVKANNLEIRTKDCLLICDCNEQDLLLLEIYNGKKWSNCLTGD